MIVYARPDGSVAVIAPAPGADPMDAVPPGATWADVSALPSRAARVAWVLQGGQVVVDPARMPPEEFAILTNWQFREMLFSLDRFTAVQTIILTQPRQVQWAWEHENRFNRRSPVLAQLAPAVGLTDAQIDPAWRAAALLRL